MTNNGPAGKRSLRPSMSSVASLSVAAVIAIVIALLPRTGNQSPPPTVAEFAPQAAREIRKSNTDQSSRFGEGEGACQRGQACAPGQKPPPPEPPPIEVPLVKQCYGDPPRQTEDPQSPPCIPYWKGNNGGATARGVTGEEIKVALPSVAFENADEVRKVNDFFNKRFQLYQRRIRLYTFVPRGNLYARPDPQQELADAKDVDEKIGAFASLSTGGRYGSEHLYYDELARRGILSVAHRAGAKTDEPYLARFSPFRWSVLPGIDTMQRHMGEFICKGLAGRPARYAGPGSRADRRVFGLIYERASDGTVPGLDLLRAQLRSCGAGFAVDEEYLEGGDANRSATNVMLKMRQGNVTSIVCFCDVADTRGSLMQAASAQQFRPEWILTTYIDNDVDNSMSQAPPDQAAQVFGVSFRNKLLPREDSFWYRGLRDADPEYDPTYMSGYALGARYTSLLLLASGIQMAGPRLTPQTFEAALQRTEFPGPGLGGAPYYQARVGFQDDLHSMYRDATVFWFDGTERGSIDPNSVGAICYADNGKRYVLGGWPRTEPDLFGTCRP